MTDDVSNLMGPLQDLRDHDPDNYSRIATAIEEAHGALRERMSKTVSLKLGFDDRTVAALGGRGAVAAVALRAAADKRHAATLRELPTDVRKALPGLMTPDEQRRFLSSRGAS